MQILLRHSTFWSEVEDYRIAGDHTPSPAPRLRQQGSDLVELVKPQRLAPFPPVQSWRCVLSSTGRAVKHLLRQLDLEVRLLEGYLLIKDWLLVRAQQGAP